MSINLMVLTAAKRLRRSDDPNIASSVYINLDLSPAEAALAYEKRQQRREARKRAVDRLNTADNAESGTVEGQAPSNCTSTREMNSAPDKTVIAASIHQTDKTSQGIVNGNTIGNNDNGSGRTVGQPFPSD